MKPWDFSQAYTPVPTKEGVTPPSPPSSLPSSAPPFASRQSLSSRKALPVVGILSAFLLLAIPFMPFPSSLAYRKEGSALSLPPREYYGESTHSPPRIWGPGLATARQNVAATFFIDFDETKESPLSTNESLSVWLEGPARLAVDVVYAGEGRFVCSYTPYDAGDYTLYVDIYQRDEPYKPYPYWRPLGRIEGYNVTVPRQDGSLAGVSRLQEISFPSHRCTGEEDMTEGRWVRCEDTPLACVRYGWIWLPRTCYFHIYTAEELAAQDLWIAVAGTSVWRGIFFAGLDHLLGERAANLSAPTSRFWKCWGRFSAETQQLQLSYLDFREECTHSLRPEVCLGDYWKNTETMLGLLGQERGGRGPDLVLWEVNAASLDFSSLEVSRKRLGKTWDGTFLAVARTESSELPWTRALTEALTREVKYKPENKIETLDM
jgi:hypothetical protein